MSAVVWEERGTRVVSASAGGRLRRVPRPAQTEVTHTIERDYRYPTAAQVLPTMDADAAFSCLREHAPDELEALLRRYPETLLQDIGY
jgi:hypothetical protein